MGRERNVLRLIGLAAIASVLALGLACQEPAREAPGAGTGLARSLCEANCARAIRCEGPRATSCDCGAVVDADLLRPDWARADIACLGRAACGMEDAWGQCESEAYRAVGATPLAWPAVVMRCLERGDTCGGSAATCRRLTALTDEARAQAMVCFGKPCEGYAACFRDFLDSRIAPGVRAWSPRNERPMYDQHSR